VPSSPTLLQPGEKGETLASLGRGQGEGFLISSDLRAVAGVTTEPHEHGQETGSSNRVSLKI
jgi:hypothetical protein